MILWIFSFFLIIYAGYYFVISLFSFQSIKPLASFPPQNKFAVLIAARNEARVIGNLIYTLNRLYNHARRILGLSAVVNGTGFMVSAGALKRLNGWNTVTMTEDLEFSALCALNGIRIHWAPNALFYDEQPLTFLQSWHQRRRWSFGMQQCLRLYWRPLLIQSFKKKSAACMDILLMFLATHMQLLGFLSFLLTIALTVFRIQYSLFPQTELTHKLLLSLDTSYLASVVASVTVLVLEGKSLRKMCKGVLFTWFFLISWIPINMISLCSKTTEWKQISHVRALSIKDVITVNLNES